MVFYVPSLGFHHIVEVQWNEKSYPSPLLSLGCYMYTCTFRVVLHKVTCDLKLLKSKYSIILSKNNFMG